MSPAVPNNSTDPTAANTCNAISFDAPPAVTMG